MADAGDVQAALEAFVYDDEDFERLESLLDEFNPFEAMRWTRQEIRHSSFLRWLLDPTETHGLRGYFLRAFLKRVVRDSPPVQRDTPSVFDVDGWEFNRTQVVQEWESIDLLVRDDGDGFVALVENKVDAAEHSDQLQRYRAVVERQFPKHKKVFVYLTVEASAPSDDSYVAVSHAEIASLVEMTLSRKRDQLSDEVKRFLEQYVEMVRRQIVEDSQVQELCRRIYEKHRRALDVLFENRPDRISEISDYLQSLIEQSDQLVPDHSSKAYVRFLPKDLDFLPKVGDGWTRSKRLILFELDSSSGSLNLKVALGPGPQVLREKLKAVIAALPKVFNKAEQRFYPKWWSFHIERWIPAREYQEADIEELKAHVKEKFAHFLQRDLPGMVEALRQLRNVPIE